MLKHHLLKEIDFVSIHGHHLQGALEVTDAHLVEEHCLKGLDLLLLVGLVPVD